MVDITHKNNTLRIATAQAIVKVSKKETIEAIQQGTVPKGDVFASSKAVGLLGIKKTPLILADCHPIPIESAHIEYEMEGLEIHIRCTIKTIYKTGVEVEAMHGASVVALNIYDMLKPIDKGVEIHAIRLLSKSGGKSDQSHDRHYNAAVIVCSDSVHAGTKEDKAGKAIIEKMKQLGVEMADYCVVPDEREQIQQAVTKYTRQQVHLVVLTGGTGLSPRDVTPEALEPLLERRIPGMEETIRQYGQQRIPTAMLSRSVAGIIGKSLVLALPGSTKGAQESIDAVFPAALHLFSVLQGERHD